MTIDFENFKDFLNAFFIIDQTDLVDTMIANEAIVRSYIHFPNETQQIYVKYWFYVDIHIYPEDTLRIVNSLHKHNITYINNHNIYYGHRSQRFVRR